VMLRSIDRAVTAADYELLARAADPAGRIVRSRCVPGFNLALADPNLRATPSPGTVSVVIVPAADGNLDTLIPMVADFLEPRRLLTTRVQVVGPRFVPIGVRVAVHLLPEAPENAMNDRVVAALSRYLDPLVGRDGSGWPFGRSVNVSEIYQLLDTLPGVDFVTRTLDATTQSPLDELVTTADFSTRLLRNDANELIGIQLKPDELVMPQIVAQDIDIQPAASIV